MKVYKAVNSKLKSESPFILVLTLIFLVFFISSCNCLKHDFFSQKKPESVTLEVLSINKGLLFFDTLIYKPTNENIIRLSKKIDKENLLVREYYSNNLYAIGKMNFKTKIGLWQTFNGDKKISEEYWLNGKVIWYSFFDSKGKLLKKVNIGIDAENF